MVDISNSFADWVGTLASPAIGSILRLSASDDLISLAPGSPDPAIFPVKEVEEIVCELLRSTRQCLQYGDGSGSPSLREKISYQQSKLLGQAVTRDEIILTHGSQQALTLLSAALLNKGDCVLVDDPTYIGALQVFRISRAEIRSIPIAVDDSLEQISSALENGLRPKLVYIVPNYANPTGLSLSAAQRADLRSLAGRYGFFLVEDDPYRELWFGDSAPVDAVFPKSSWTIQLGSFSKSLFPAARLGFIVASARLAEVLGKLKEATDLGNSNLLESTVAAMLDRSGLANTIAERAREVYRHRRDVLVESVTDALGKRLRFVRPEGGFFLWCHLDGVSATALLAESLAENISFVPGEVFYAGQPDVTSLRLSYSHASIEGLAEAGPRLATALRRVRR